MKLNNAQVCLDCEELYVGDQCPKCCSLNYFYLRKYFEPLQRFGGHYEPVTVRVFNPLPANLRRIQGNITVNPDSFTADPACGEFVDDGPQAPHTLTISQRSIDEAGAVAKAGGLDRTSRVLGEAISRLLKICRGLDASPSSDMEAQMEQKAAHGPGA